ncbi:DivIVA domain-containing protein, partial [Clostridioides difficile]|uniref:DivIVA domain-containing protein n=1 Tax=Clostridioides difficile TaxID=1496 RepID=UPI0023587AD2
IQQKHFSNKMRGYNPDEVDEFLDDVAFEQRRLHDEIDSLRRQLAEAKSRVEYFAEMKESLNKSIMVAPDAADKVKISSTREAEFTAKEAQKEAEGVVKNAHKKADGYIGEAAGKAQKVIVATDDSKKQARSFRQKLEVLLESQLQMIK